MICRSLEGLARVEEKVEMTLQEQADADYAHIVELVRDYLSLVAAVKVDIHQTIELILNSISGCLRRKGKSLLHLADGSHHIAQKTRAKIEDGARRTAG